MFEVTPRQLLTLTSISLFRPNSTDFNEVDVARGVGTKRKMPGVAMKFVRGFFHMCVTMVCIGMVAGGLYMSLEQAGEGVVLDRPGEPGRIDADRTSATAFFEILGDKLELTMLFTEPHDPNSVFKKRVMLTDGETHSIIIGGETQSGATRFTFRRVGYSIEMRLAQATTLGASLEHWN